jgi:hypothetical protein
MLGLQRELLFGRDFTLQEMPREQLVPARIMNNVHPPSNT